LHPGGAIHATRLHECPTWRIVRRIGIETFIDCHDDVDDRVENDPAQGLGEQFAVRPSIQELRQGLVLEQHARHGVSAFAQIRRSTR